MEKRFLAVMLSAAMLGGICPVHAADGEDVIISPDQQIESEATAENDLVLYDDADWNGFSDDFNAYELADKKVGVGSSVTNNVWTISKVNCGGRKKGASSVDLIEGENKCLTLYGGINVTTPAAVNLAKAQYLGLEDSAELQASVRQNGNDHGGIRFMVSSDEKNYYTIYAGDTGEGFFLEKVIKQKPVWTKPIAIENKENAWYRISLANYASSLIWSVTDLSDGTEKKGVTDDPEMLETAGKDAGYQLFIQGISSSVSFDDVSLNSATKKYQDLLEQNDAFYCDVLGNAKGQKNETGMIWTLSEATAVKRIRLTSEKEQFPDGIKVYFANQPDFSDQVLIGESSSVLGTVWNLYNYVTTDSIQYIRIEGQEISDTAAFAAADSSEELKLILNDHQKIFLKMNGTWENLSWTVENPEILQFENGTILAQEKGSTTLTAESNGASVVLSIRVVSEMEDAVETGTTAEYVNRKKPLVEMVNQAIKSSDAQKMLDILQNDISGLKDSPYRVLETLSTEKLQFVAAGMLTYPEFGTNGLIDLAAIQNLINALEQEIAAAALSNVSDPVKVQKLLETYGAWAGCDVTNPYYQDYADATAKLLTDKSFQNGAALKKAFCEGYVWAAFSANEISLKYKEILEDNQEVIGYNQKHYQELKDPSKLYDNILRNKSSITSLRKLADYMDSYKETTSGGGSGGGGGNSSSGSTGSGGKKGNGNIIAPSVPQKTEQEQKSSFSDVPSDHWAFASIAVLSSKKIVNGYEDGSFHPDDSITRAEFASMLVTAFALTGEEDAADFTDCSEGDWFYQNMKIASSNGVIRGTDGACMPNQKINREEMAAMIYRLLKDQLGEATTAVVQFTDEEEISDWAFPAVKNLQTREIISGMPDGSFSPKTAVTRAQAAKVIHTAIQK